MSPPIAQRALFDNMDHERAAKVMATVEEANRRRRRTPSILGRRYSHAVLATRERVNQKIPESLIHSGAPA